MADESAELRELRAKLEELSQRVARLEQNAPAAAAVPPGPLVESRKLESRFGLTVINRIGAVTLAIGILFFLKYAVESPWISAAGRIILGLTGGLLLIAAADWLRSRKQRVFSQGLCGCGLAVVYAAIYAAFGYYQLVSFSIAFFGLAVSCGLAVLLSLRYESAAIASLGIAGAFLEPLLLGRGSLSFGEAVAFFVCVSASATTFAAWRQWMLLLLSSAPEALLAAQIESRGESLGLMALFNFLLAFGYFTASCIESLREPFRKAAYVTAHVCLLIGFFRLLQLWSRTELAPTDRGSFLSAAVSILVAAYAVALILWGSLRVSGVNRALGLSLMGLVITKLYLYDVWLLERLYRIAAFCALGALLLGASYVYSRSRAERS